MMRGGIPNQGPVPGRQIPVGMGQPPFMQPQIQMNPAQINSQR